MKLSATSGRHGPPPSRPPSSMSTRASVSASGAVGPSVGSAPSFGVASASGPRAGPGSSIPRSKRHAPSPTRKSGSTSTRRTPARERRDTIAGHASTRLPQRACPTPKPMPPKRGTRSRTEGHSRQTRPICSPRRGAGRDMSRATSFLLAACGAPPRRSTSCRASPKRSPARWSSVWRASVWVPKKRWPYWGWTSRAEEASWGDDLEGSITSRGGFPPRDADGRAYRLGPSAGSSSRLRLAPSRQQPVLRAFEQSRLFPS